MSVLCLVEHDGGEPLEASLRALTFARRLAVPGEPLAAVVMGGIPDATRAILASFGAGDLYSVLFEETDSYAPLAWARALAGLAAESAASAVVAVGTDRGNEVMAHLATIEGGAMVANCISAERTDASRLRLSRQRWGGSLIEDAELDAKLALLTVAVDAVLAEPAEEGGAATVREHRPVLEDGDLAVRVSSFAPQASGISLAEARVVIGGGRGVGSAEGFAAIDELAALLGAAVGVSRAVTSAGWRSHAQQVGQTGTRISPELYMACGISGAVQHLAGCQSAKCVVAINTDADAPMMFRADYAVVGDLAEVIPALVGAIRGRGA